MSTAAIIANVIMSLLVLGGIGAALMVATLGLSGDEGRASGRGPLHVAPLAPG